MKIYVPIKPTQGKQHGKFDIAIIKNPNEITEYKFNKIIHAFELKYEARASGTETRNTLKKHL